MSDLQQSNPQENYISILSAYCKDITKYRLITREEEISLCRSAQEGDLESRNKVITANLRLVILISKKYIHKGLPFEDLISHGNFGLFNAVRKFDINSGFRFSTYASLWITQAILRAIENSGRIRIPSYMQFIRKKLDKIKNIMSMSGSRNIPIKSILDQAVGKHYKITKKTINDVIKANEISSVGSLDDGITGPSLGDTTCIDIIDNESIIEITKLVELLPDRSKNIIRMRFGIGYERPMTLLEISNSINPTLTKERVRQIIFETICRLKQEMERIGIDSFGD